MKKIFSILPFLFALVCCKAQQNTNPTTYGNPVYLLKWLKVHDSIRASIYLQNTNDTLATKAYARGFAGGSIGQGYGVKVTGSTVAIDTANFRKVDSLYPVTDSTFILKINGHAYSYKMRGAVFSFAGRLGAIVPQDEDYAAFYAKLDYTYNDPSFIAQLNFAKLIGLPTTLAGHNITNGVINGGGSAQLIADVEANRPTAPLNGTWFLGIDDSTLRYWNGSQYITVAGGGVSGPDSVYQFKYGLLTTRVGDTVKTMVDTTTLKAVFGSASPGVFQLYTKYGLVINGIDTASVDTTLFTRWSDTLTKIASRSYVLTRGYLTSESDPVATAKTIAVNQVTGAGVTVTGTASQAVGSNPSWTIKADTTVLATHTGLADTSAILRALIGSGGSGIAAVYNKYGTIIANGDSISVDSTIFPRYKDTLSGPLATRTYVTGRGYLTTEADPVATAKTIALNQVTGAGVLITGLTSQTIGSNPAYTLKADTTVLSTLTGITDTATALRTLIGSKIATIYNKYGTIISSGDSIAVDTSLILPAHRLADTAGVLRTLIATKANADSTIWQTKYRSDTSRTNIYAALGGKANADSTLWQTKYRSDTGRTNVYAALALKAPLASPALTGTPTAPSAAAKDSTTKIATTLYVDRAVAAATFNLGDSAVANGFSLTKNVTGTSITLGFDSTTGFHTQPYNDIRYRKTWLDSMYNGLIRDTTKILHDGGIWGMYTTGTSDTIYDKAWNNTPGDAYIRTGTDSANYVVLKQKIAAGSCTSCNLSYDSAGQITVAANGSGGAGNTNLSVQLFSSFDSIKSSTGTGAELDTANANTGGHAGVQSYFSYTVTHSPIYMRHSLAFTGDTLTYANADTLYYRELFPGYGMKRSSLNSIDSFAYDVDTSKIATQPDISILTSALALKAPLASPALTGTPTVPTASPGTNTTQAASTAFVAASFAPLASPALTGTPTAPTAGLGTNTTQLATTAFVQAAMSSVGSGVTTVNPFSASSQVNGGTISGTTITFGPADATNPGMVTAGTQTLYGTKTFNSNLAVPAGLQIGSNTNTMQWIGTSTGAWAAALNIPGTSTHTGSDWYLAYDSSGTWKGKLHGYATGQFQFINYGKDAFTGMMVFGLGEDASGNMIELTKGVDFSGGTSSLATGIVKSTAGTGNLTIAVASDFPILNQNTTGTAAALGNPSTLPLGTLASTQTQGDNTTYVATDAFVTLGLSAKAPLASPALTGIPTAPTASAGTNTTQVATTAFVATSFAPLASPALTGTPTVPTATTGTNTTQAASTAFVQNAVSGYASLSSPALTGTPTAPTATTGTNTTQIATTAFANAAATAAVNSLPNAFTGWQNVTSGGTFTINRQFVACSPSTSQTITLDLPASPVDGQSEDIYIGNGIGTASVTLTISTGGSIGICYQGTNGVTSIGGSLYNRGSHFHLIFNANTDQWFATSQTY